MKNILSHPHAAYDSSLQVGLFPGSGTAGADCLPVLQPP